MPKFILTALQVFVLLAAMSIGRSANADESELMSIHEDIVADYEEVEHMTADAVLALLPDERVIFDVREPQEFAVSHIAGAIRLDPGITAEAFVERYSEMLDNRTVIFYCSVGRRSSMLSQRLDDTIAERGAIGSYNLVGGIFQWRNEQRPLVDNDGETQAVHPYNRYWGRLVTDKAAIRYEK